jgi:hypothetical protein
MGGEALIPGKACRGGRIQVWKRAEAPGIFNRVVCLLLVQPYQESVCLIEGFALRET